MCAWLKWNHVNKGIFKKKKTSHIFWHLNFRQADAFSICLIFFTRSVVYQSRVLKKASCLLQNKIQDQKKSDLESFAISSKIDFVNFPIKHFISYFFFSLPINLLTHSFAQQKKKMKGGKIKSC